MVAEPIEAVAIEPARYLGQARAKLVGEYLVAELLRRLDLGRALGEAHLQVAACLDVLRLDLVHSPGMLTAPCYGPMIGR